MNPKKVKLISSNESHDPGSMEWVTSRVMDALRIYMNKMKLSPAESADHCCTLYSDNIKEIRLFMTEEITIVDLAGIDESKDGRMSIDLDYDYWDVDGGIADNLPVHEKYVMIDGMKLLSSDVISRFFRCDVCDKMYSFVEFIKLIRLAGNA